MRRVTVSSMVMLCLLSLQALAESPVLKFDGGIGVIPVSSVNAQTGVVARNVVRGVPPGGQPWVIARLTAEIETDGRIRVDGRGLLLAGGDRIGTNANASVKAVLFCGAPGSAVASESAIVALDPAGDFRIDGTLSPVPASPCDSPVLLIESAGGSWFAAGILKQ
jgi:hypothetical protein